MRGETIAEEIALIEERVEVGVQYAMPNFDVIILGLTCGIVKIVNPRDRDRIRQTSFYIMKPWPGKFGMPASRVHPMIAKQVSIKDYLVSAQGRSSDNDIGLDRAYKIEICLAGK